MSDKKDGSTSATTQQITSTTSETKTEPPGNAKPREDLLDPAVKFLQNYKVQQRPLEQRKAFLRSKGLTDGEIEIAFERAGPPQVLPVSPYQSPVPVQPLPVMAQKKSYLELFKDYSAIAVIFGSVVYAVYWCYKKFIEPYFNARQEKQDARLQAIEDAIGDLHQKVAADAEQASEKRVYLEDELVNLAAAVGNITTLLQVSKDRDLKSAVKPLHDDMSSLKSLILSSKQFPANPVTRPMIPSWQMKTEEQTKVNGLSGGGDEEASAIESNGSTKSNANPVEKSKLEEDTDDVVEQKDLEVAEDSIALAPN